MELKNILIEANKEIPASLKLEILKDKVIIQSIEGSLKFNNVNLRNVRGSY